MFKRIMTVNCMRLPEKYITITWLAAVFGSIYGCCLSHCKDSTSWSMKDKIQKRPSSLLILHTKQSRQQELVQYINP